VFSRRSRLEGSQVSKARPGAPFDFTLRYCRGHKLLSFLSRLASASRLLLGMTKEGVVVIWKVVAGPKVMKKHIFSSNHFSSVIPSEAEGSAVPRTLSWKCFSDRA